MELSDLINDSVTTDLFKIERELETQYQEEQNEIQTELQTFPKRTGISSDPYKAGMKIVDSINNILSKLDKWNPRSKHQRLMHDAMIVASIPQIFGPSYVDHKDLIMKKLGIRKIQSELAILCQRRFGKSMAIAGYMTAFLIAMPSGDSSIYALVKRASYAMLCRIYSMCYKLGEDQGINYIVNSNQELLEVVNEYGGTCTVRAYPGTSDGLRGTGDMGIIIIEEAGFMKPDVIQSIIFPILIMANMVLIIVTSHDSRYGFMNRIVNITYDDGSPLFHTITFSLVCDDCKEKGLEFECQHKLGELPHWMSSDQYQKLAKLQSGNSTAFLRETKGFLIEPLIKPAFNARKLECLLTPERLIPIKSYVSDIITTVDTCGGSTGSEYAIVSCAYINRKIVVSIIVKIFEFFFMLLLLLLWQCYYYWKNVIFKNLFEYYVIT